MVSQFSKDCKYYAHISVDGKLKIWNTLSNSFEQEFTPDFHLSSPFTCLNFIELDYTKDKGATPRKKKRRLSESSGGHHVVLGTSSGMLMVYSVLQANLEYSINSETQQSISCITTENSTVYTGTDQNLLVWSLDRRKLVDKWKAGEEKISAIASVPVSVPSSKRILTASKSIKLWNTETKEVLKTFTGHSSDIIFLHVVLQLDKEPSYVISGSKGDRILSCWNLASSDKNSMASFFMEDVVHNLSVASTNESTNIAVCVRSGVVHIYQHILNGKCSKPVKAKTTIQVVSEHSENVMPIRVFGATYRTDNTLCICYGKENLLTFENVAINSQNKVQCLVRNDPGSALQTKEEQKTKVQSPIVSNDVHYSSSQKVNVVSKRKSEFQTDIPMEKRLENLAINNVDGKSKIPRGDNMAQLLLQGLQSKDKNIVRTVLCKKDEQLIKNTVKRLPITALVSLIKELNVFMQGKTLSCQIGSVWLKAILQIHAGLLISNPELPELLGAALGNIEQRLTLLTPLMRLKGRINLILPQVCGYSNNDANDEEEPLFTYNDKDFSDSDEVDLQLDGESDSANEWEEDDEEEEDEDEENNKDGSEDEEVENNSSESE